MIKIPFLPADDISTLFQQLANVPSHPIACVNWKDYDYAPQVEVKIAQSSAALLLQYAVQEKCIRAKCTQGNGEVWKDSCVEFFVSLDNKKTYYNFELNCIGVPLLRYNQRPHEGPMATPQVLADIHTKSSLGTQPIALQSGNFAWTLSAAIPYTCFFAHNIKNLAQETVFANLYKCGDELETPHFLSLFPIHTPTPNFHCPEFFEQLGF